MYWHTSRSRLTGAKEERDPIHGRSCQRLFLMRHAPSSMGLFRLPIDLMAASSLGYLGDLSLMKQ